METKLEIEIQLTNASYGEEMLRSTQRDGGLAIVRVKPLGAGGGGVESSAAGTGMRDGVDGAVFYSPGSTTVDVRTPHSIKTFSYPRHVVPPTTDNARLFEEFLPHRIDAFFEGVNVNVLCYGQTGTGKTHTIFGSPGIMARAGRGDYGMSAADDYGLFPRALLDIYHRAQAMGGAPACVLTCSVIELAMYGNKCLFDTGRTQTKQGLVSPESYGVTIDKAAKPPKMYGMEEIVLESDADLLRTFAAVAARNTAGTGMNDSSSRSHCFATLMLYVKVGDDKVRVTRFQFVDLAGSERLKDASGTTDFRDTEQAFSGMLTNYSLTMLAQATNALVQQRARERRRKRTPKPFSFRAYLFDLVILLSESLEGKALTTVCVCVSQAPANATQAAFSLEFGATFSKLNADGRGTPVRPATLGGLFEKYNAQRREAARVLAKGVPPKWVNVRMAQLTEARQMLRVLQRLGVDVGDVVDVGGGGGGAATKASSSSGGRRRGSASKMSRNSGSRRSGGTAGTGES